MLLPPHSHVWQILHPALSVVPGTIPMLYIKFSESIKVEGLCYLDTLVSVCRPPVIRTESSSSSPPGMAQASLQIFINIEDVRDY